MKRAVTVTLPAPYAAEIACPICEGNKCLVCKMTGTMKIKVAPKIPIQRAHIIKYVVDNLVEVSAEVTRMYGLVPEINTTEMVEVNGEQYEIVQISSIGGACWIANCLSNLESPQYFTSRKALTTFKEGMQIE
jgi:hypothetical protein